MLCVRALGARGQKPEVTDVVPVAIRHVVGQGGQKAGRGATGHDPLLGPRVFRYEPDFVTADVPEPGRRSSASTVSAWNLGNHRQRLAFRSFTRSASSGALWIKRSLPARGEQHLLHNSNSDRASPEQMFKRVSTKGSFFE